MKLSLEIELDWIDEEMNIDDTVKQNVIDTIVSKIQKNIEAKIENEINSKIDEVIVDKINEMTENLFNDFLTKEVVISDKYGDKLTSYANVNALIKKRFDDFMTQSVNENGKTDNGSYGKKFKRLEYIIDMQLKTFAEEFTNNAVKQVSEEIKLHVQDGLTNKLGAELMKVLKVNKMLGIPKP